MAETSGEVVIVGAGPAGLYAGLLMAEQGRQVIVLEGRAEVTAPIRSGGISPTSWIPDDIQTRFQKAILHERIEIPISISGVNHEESASSFDAIIFDREILERELAVSFVHAGGRLETRRTVQDISPEGSDWTISALGPVSRETWTAQQVILADGIDGSLARRLGARERDHPGEMLVQACATHHVGADRPGHLTYGTGSRCLTFPQRPGRATLMVVHRHRPERKILKALVEAEARLGLEARVQVVIGGVPITAPGRLDLPAGISAVGQAVGGGDPVLGLGLGHALRGVQALIGGDQAGWDAEHLRKWQAGMALTTGEVPEIESLADYLNRWP